MPEITYREALRQAFAEEIERDENVVIIGEEVAEYDGAYKVTEGLWKRFGDKRIVDTPISEAAFIGMGVGASMLGLRPVMELMFWSFATVAWDQIVNNAGFVRYMSGGLINCPIVIRGPANAGTNVGATHSHTPENMLANVPGLKVVCPATAYDAKGLMKTAIRDNDPVMFMENTLLYGEKWEVPEEEYLIPLGVADLKREGTDISLDRPRTRRAHRAQSRRVACRRARYQRRSARSPQHPPARRRGDPGKRPQNASRAARRGKQTVLRRRRADLIDPDGESVR